MSRTDLISAPRFWGVVTLLSEISNESLSCSDFDAFVCFVLGFLRLNLEPSMRRRGDSASLLESPLVVLARQRIE